MDLSRVYEWEMPTRIVFGPGCARRAGQEMRQLGATKVLLVTDPGVRGAGALATVVEGLDTAGVAYAVFDGVEPNPDIPCVERAVGKYKEEDCDSILAVGGGSSIDAAKAAGGAITNPSVAIKDMAGKNKIANPLPPFIAIPTTCGTGSEVTVASVITDPVRRFKMGMRSPYFAPKVTFIDGTLLSKLPGSIIASTGMDAFCHALESYTNLNANPISDAVDLKAISIISQWLRPAVANANLEAMSLMLLASTMAGMGFSNTQVTIVHAMSHPVSAYFGVGHGMANAILLPHVMEYNLIGNAQRFADIAKAMGEDTAGLSPMEGARRAVKAVRELNQDVGIPETLAACGVTTEHLDTMIEDTMLSAGVPLNPVRVTREAVRGIYLRAIGS